MWGTFDLARFKVILGSFSALFSNWPTCRCNPNADGHRANRRCHYYIYSVRMTS